MRALVVEDDPMIGRAVVAGLRHGGYAVDWVRDGAEAALAFANGVYELALLDLGLPRRDGLEILKNVRRTGGKLPILIITARDAVADRIAGLDAGADDYLVKPFAMDELLARSRALLRRSSGVSPRLTFEDVAVDLETRQAFRGDRSLHLTPREYDLLVAFLRHPRQALSRDQLCQQVWGFAFEGESNFIDVAVKELRKKLEAGDRSRLIQTVRGYGYALREF